MRSYASELREVTAIIQMPQHVKEVASMTQLPVKKAHSLMEIIAILASQQLAVHADGLQDYSDVYDAMVSQNLLMLLLKGKGLQCIFVFRF